MPDDLRTRIKHAIDQAHASSKPHGTYDDWLTFAADAVIRELEAGYVLVPKNVTLVQWADEAFKGQREGEFKHERITEWTTDE